MHINKTISAPYYTVEAIVNAIFSLKKQKTRGFSGRASLIRMLFGMDMYRQYLKLHELREKADHKEIIFDQSGANSAFEAALAIFEILEKKFKELISVK
ncbi:MAG: hypothetical protein ACTSU6_05950 [Candidatus Njordarchaeales archaeon]